MSFKPEEHFYILTVICLQITHVKSVSQEKEMIKLKYSKITHPEFQKALFSLAKERLPAKTAFNLKTMINRIEQKVNEADSIRLGLVGDYCEKDENGALLMQKDEDGNDVPGSVVPLKEKEEEFKQKFIEYLSTEVEIKGYKFRLDELESAKVDVSTLMQLEPLIEEEGED